jgi:hypothetical protein
MPPSVDAPVVGEAVDVINGQIARLMWGVIQVGGAGTPPAVGGDVLGQEVATMPSPGCGLADVAV